MTSDPLNQIELISTLSVPRYAPRLKPTPIPGARWDEEPLYCLQINDEWVSHLLGVMTALDQPDTWLGTPEEIYDARQQVNEIMVAFMEQCDPMNNCCPEPNRTRYDEDGNYEISYDGGTTWVSGADSDPRYTSPQWPPLSGDDGSVKRCQAANSVVAEIELKVAYWGDLLEAGGTFVEFALAAIAALVVGIFAPAAVPFIFGVCLAILQACYNHGAEDWDDAFTGTVFDDLLCIVFCNAQPDGTFTQADVNKIIGDIASTFASNTIARDAFTAAFRGWGGVGTSNAAVINNGSRSCDDCECPQTCPEKWKPRFDDPSLGVITEVGEDYIIAETTTPQPNGVYYISLWTNDAADPNICCYISSVEVLTGSASVNIGSPCGDGGTARPLLLPNCLWWIEPQSTIPFSVRINIGDCP